MKKAKFKLVVSVHAASGTAHSLAKEYDLKKQKIKQNTLYTYKVNANVHAWSVCWSWILVAWHISYEVKKKKNTQTWTIFILILLSFNLLLLMCLLAKGTFVLCCCIFFAWVCSVAGDLWMWRCSSCAMYLQKLMCIMYVQHIYYS